MSKFLAAALHVVAVLGLDRILDGAGHWVVDTQDGALDQLDSTGGISAQVSSSISPSGSLSLAPSFGRRGLAASVRRRDSTGHTKGRSGIFRISCVVGVVVSWSGICRVGFGQAVARGGANGGVTARLWVIKGSRKWTLMLGQKSSGSVLILSVLLNFWIVSISRIHLTVPSCCQISKGPYL